MEDNKSPWLTNVEVTNVDDTQFTPQLPQLEEVSWTASEFISHQKSSTWYIGLGAAAAVVTLIVFVVTGNIFSALVVAMAFMALGVFAARKPATIEYRISPDGIYAGQRLYPYNMFKSYSVVQDGAVNCIWLRPLKKLMPTVVMYYPSDDEDKILDTLDNFLAQEDREHDALDRFSRRIRF
jgi:hypothetical protein